MNINFIDRLRRFILPETEDSSLKSRVQWYVSIRWLFLLSVAVPGILSQIIPQGFTAQVARDLALAIVALGSNFLFYCLSQNLTSRRALSILSFLLIAIDIITITYLIYTKGGVESRSPILYVVPILLSSLVFGRRGLYTTTVMSIAAYDILIILDFANVIHSIGAVNPSLRSDTPYVINTVSFFTSVLLVIGVLADFVVGLLNSAQSKASERAKSLVRAQEIAKIGNWEWDMKTNKVSWSDEIYKIFGVAQSHFKPTFENYLKLVHPDDQHFVETTVSESATNGKPFSFDHRIKLKDNKIKWVHSEGSVETDINGLPLRMTGIAQDITEQKIAQLAMNEKAAELEKLNALMINREIKMVELKRKSLNKESSREEKK